MVGHSLFIVGQGGVYEGLMGMLHLPQQVTEFIEGMLVADAEIFKSDARMPNILSKFAAQLVESGQI